MWIVATIFDHADVNNRSFRKRMDKGKKRQGRNDKFKISKN